MIHKKIFKIMYLAGTLFFFLCLSSVANAGDSAYSKLFGTISFQRPMGIFGQWINVQKRNKANRIFSNADIKLRSSETTASLLSKARKLTGMQRLHYVNTFWNRYPYVQDIKNWRQNDYWAIPAEFIKKSGDCEDYAIIKYYTLLELGQPDDTMRIVVLKDTLRKLAHAVLAVQESGKVFILDNVSNAIVSHDRLLHYSPAYSLNQGYAFVHIKGRKL